MRNIIYSICLLLILLILVILFRGPVYRLTFSYQVTGNRKLIPCETPLIKESPINNLEQVLSFSHEFVNDNLRYSFKKESRDPNIALRTGRANCVGYAALFANTLEQSLQQADLEREYQVSHVVGRLHLFGLDVHRLVRSPFFQDHDFVLLESRDSTFALALDPSLSDVLDIQRVRVK